MMMHGKRGLVVGVANKWSIAWAITQKLAAEGAELALTYQNDRLGKNVKDLTEELPGEPLLIPLDVTNDKQIVMTFELLKRVWGHLDFLVHAVAFAPRQALEGSFVGTTREDFRIAHDISSYSLTALTHSALPLMGEGSSVLTLSYLGAERAIPNYNVMGVAKASLEASVRYLAESLGPRGMRVNGISAGPIKTLAASGIKDFGKFLGMVAAASPLRRNVTIEDVGNVAAFLLSDLAGGVTAEITYVDGGFSHTAGISRETDAA